MSHPTPLRSFVGGLGLPLAVHALAVLNGKVFGISGFVNQAVHGNIEAIAGVCGIVGGGIVAGLIEGAPVANYFPAFPQLFLSGFLVGVGAKLANGCTSGWVWEVIEKAARSIAATATFFCTGMITAHIFHSQNSLFVSSPFGVNYPSNFERSASTLLGLQLIPFSSSLIQYGISSSDKNKASAYNARIFAMLNNGFQFALALALSNIDDNKKVISFLLLPSLNFDPSLAFLALGALPLAIILNFFIRGKNVPALGGTWAIPKGGIVDTKLLLGAAIFGIGWGWSGICHGPGLVNLGRSIAAGRTVLPHLVWLGATTLGGFLA